MSFSRGRGAEWLSRRMTGYGTGQGVPVPGRLLWGETALCFEMFVMTLRCAKGQPFKQDEFDGQTN